MLTWDAIPLYSRRVMTFTDTNSIEPSPSNESAETLSISDIPSNRCLFRLRLSAHPTEETGCSSLPLMQTPTVVMTREDPVAFRTRAERNHYKNGTKYGSLESQLIYDPRFKGLLKTPSEFDGTAGDGKKKPISGDSGSLAQEIMNGYAAKRGLILPTPLSVEREHPKRVQALKDAGATEMFSRENGSARPNGLMDHLNFYGLLPTPNAVEATKYTNTYNPESQMGQSLSAMAGSGMLPTPNAMDWNTEYTPEQKEACLERRAQEGRTAYPSKFNMLRQMAVEGLLPTPTARDEKNPSSPDGERIARKMEQGYTIELNDLAAMGALPTPDSSPKTDGQAFRLSPLFTEEMMGFPFGWTTFPFLSPDGEPSPSKPTGTQ